MVRSILSWLVPFGSGTMRKNPALTLVSFFFHGFVILTPVFLHAHNVLWYESWGIQWWSLPEGTADLLTVFVIAACGFFLIRRIMVPEVREVTKPSDFALLALVVLPFVFGFLAYHGWGPYRPMLILHVLSGEVLLVVIPFSRLGHMLLFAFGRAQIGREIAPSAGVLRQRSHG
jgi:nitrate reductase gamma subunit